jgi:hypothetical protein
MDKPHPSKDVTLEGTPKIHRPKWQTAADLVLRAIGVGPANPLEARASGGVKTEWVFPGLSALRKNKKMEVLYPEN